jgi:NTE family protein
VTPRHLADTENIFTYSLAVIGTMLDAHDRQHISTAKGDYQRSILIPTEIHTSKGKSVIHTTDFSITPEESEALFQNGKKATEQFLSTWDFGKWKTTYRK